MVWKEQIEKLNRIGISLSSELDLETLLECVVREARAFTRADGGSLYTIENGKLVFDVVQNETLGRRQEPPPGFKPYPLSLSQESIAGYVAMTGEILNLEDVYHLPGMAPYAFNPDFDERNDYVTKSMLVVPMKDREKQTVGVLQLINRIDENGRVGFFPESAEHLVMSLASQAAVALRNARLLSEIKALLESLIQYSATAIDARSPHTAGHSKRVAEYARAIARAINEAATGPFAESFFSPDQMEELSYAAWLHDIGKIGVPETILDKGRRLSEEAMAAVTLRFELIKVLRMTRLREDVETREDAFRSWNRMDKRPPIERETEADLLFLRRINAAPSLSEEDLDRLRAMGSRTFEDLEGKRRPCLTKDEMEALSVKKGNLTPEEYKRIQGHVETTFNIVKKIPFPKRLENVPLFSATHHELLDGSGYPRGLKGDEIPLQSRILAVADVFDALTAADRPYRPAAPAEEGGKRLQAEAKAGRLDQDIVRLFLHKELHNS